MGAGAGLAGGGVAGAGTQGADHAVTALEHAGITNVNFERLSEIERMWKAGGGLVEGG